MALKSELQNTIAELRSEKEAILRIMYDFAARKLQQIGKYEYWIANDLMSKAYCSQEIGACRLQYDAYVISIEVIEGLGRQHVEETVRKMPESKYEGG